MKLNAITILSREMFADQWRRPDFSLKEIWKNIENGTLESFEQDLAKQNDASNTNQAAQARQLHIAEILQCIRRIHGNEDAEAFLQDGRLNATAITESLKPFLENSLSKDDLNFLSRNTNKLATLFCSCEEGWNSRQVHTLYLFLLLHLQILPKDPIREKDVSFLAELLRQQQPPKVAHRAPSRLCLTEDMVLRCNGNEISCYDLRKRSGWTTFHRCDEPVAGIAFTEPLGLIAFTQSGKLCSGTSVKIIAAAAGKRIVMASAYERQYILLAADGTVISNLPVANDPVWKSVSWVSAGLNSVSGISGKMDNAIEYGLDWNMDYTDVKTIVTRSTGNSKRFAVLKNDGTLEFDQGSPVDGVSAVCLDSRGYIYLKDSEIFLRPYEGGPDRLAAKLPADMNIEEFHCAGNVFLCGTAEKPYLGMLRPES